MERIGAALIAEERPVFEAWLDFPRATLALKCEGLFPEQLSTRPVPPSSLSLVGLARHMAEVERRWFQRCLAGDDVPPPQHRRRTGPRLRRRVPDNALECLSTWEIEFGASRSAAASIDSLGETGARSWRRDEVSAR